MADRLLIAVLLWAGPVAYVVWQLGQWRSWRARGREPIEHGTVEAAEAPVVIETDERRAKAGDWETLAVRTRAVAFGLRRATGELVRVEPGEHVTLRWPADASRVDPAHPTRRTQIATLAIGTAVDVAGELVPAAGGAPYRDDAVGVLRPRAGEPLQISKRPLRTQDARRARFHARRAAAVLGVVAFLHALAGPLWKTDLALAGLPGDALWARCAVGLVAAVTTIVYWDRTPPGK